MLFFAILFTMFLMEMHRQVETTGQHCETLSIQQMHHIIEVLERREWKACAAAVALMLWGGVGFNSLRRLRWLDVLDAPNSIVPSMPEQVVDWMKKQGYLGVPEAPVVPRGWNRRWLRLKTEIGINDARVLTETYRYYCRQEGGPVLPMGHGN